ncbi:hypothetical protein AMEX_G2088 [Astyanax mexicanus]|uniref:CARD domain-containing protein n=1 Tax=Astyanax mexicanus TaxID=7994 RepID=A0A8T2MRV3_ASTMX|nr:hypothetical protein AMEX_G2088 [Astyanax mexicanus]
MLASSAQMSRDLAPGSEVRQTVKAHLLASQKLLVDSMYNLAPLLDCMLSTELLSQDNYHEIKAEKTPQNRARKLLEIVQAQMDESEARRFLECLKECKQQYPRLRNWLSSETGILSGQTDMSFQTGSSSTERRLQAQFYSLCGRLGSSVLPISLALFSSSTLTQFDLERIQAAPTPTQQTQTLLCICLTKGESACRSFYEALHNEDEQLAEDMNVTSMVEGLSISSKARSESSNVPIAVEETRDTAEGHLPYSGVLRKVKAQLSVGEGDEARLNICELGVAVGLPRRTTKESLLEGVGIEDSSQLEALVSLFMEKTQDADRLVSRVAELDIQKVRLSERGCLSLKLLQEAEAILRSGCHSHLHKWDHLHDQDHLHGLDQLHVTDCREQCRVWTVFSFLLWDCLVEALEEPELKPSGDSKGRSLTGALQCLRGCERVEADLLQELELCWEEGGAENLLQSIRVLAQILRDLYPFQDHFKLSGPSVEGLYSCRFSRIHRVTSFQGISARMIKKALNSVGPVSSHRDLTHRAQQYRDLCLQIARLLNTVQLERSSGELTNAPITNIIQHICLTLSKPSFNSRAFNAGIRHRLLTLTEFIPTQLCLGTLMQLHQETLSELQLYLQRGEHHNFQFDPQSVQILGPARLLSVSSARGPTAIDNGVEEDFRFVASEATSFLVRLRCLGYEEIKGFFEVSEPRCFLASQLGENGHHAIRWLGDVLAEEENKIWIREGGTGWREELETVARRHSIQLCNEGCLFRVTTSQEECEVKFMYRAGRLWATAQKDCEVL